MWISKNYSTEDWEAIEFKNEEDWEIAINIFRDRLDSRFLKYIEIIEKYLYSGFAVMALDCLLIETISQFYRGVSSNRGCSKLKYKNFLKKHFEAFNDDIAEKFYDHFRCGILHQAETKKNSKIRIKDSLPIVKYTDDGNGLIINRKKFHKELLGIIDNYIEKLKDPIEKDLREKFRRKMNIICRVKAN